MAMTASGDSAQYDETALSDAINQLEPGQRVLFACACAELLMPTYRWYCDNKNGADYQSVREALDAAWSAGKTESLHTSPGLSAMRTRVEELVPSDDNDILLPGSAVAQNAVAGVAYALRVWETSAPQEAVWAARQVYEAADVVAQQVAPTQTYVNDVESEAPVRFMLQRIEAVLRNIHQVDELQAAANAGGEEFLKFLTDPLD